MSVLLVRQQRMFGIDVPSGFAVLGLDADRRAALLQGGDAVALEGNGRMLMLSEVQAPATWYNGEVASVVTPALTANGDLSSGTDLVPLLWRIVPAAQDDVAAAQQLKDGGPNIITLGLGGFDEQSILSATSGEAEVMTAAYAVCVSATAVPGSYAGSSNIVAQTDNNLASWLAAMKRFDWSGGLGATYVRAMSTPAYGAGTLQSQLMLQAGAL
jgi:hypothetical protein